MILTKCTTFHRRLEEENLLQIDTEDYYVSAFPLTINRMVLMTRGESTVENRCVIDGVFLLVRFTLIYKLLHWALTGFQWTFHIFLSFVNNRRNSYQRVSCAIAVERQWNKIVINNSRVYTCDAINLCSSKHKFFHTKKNRRKKREEKMVQLHKKCLTWILCVSFALAASGE